MSGIYTYIQVIFVVNVAKYSIHGSYGYKKKHIKTDEVRNTSPNFFVGPNQLSTHQRSTNLLKGRSLNFGYQLSQKNT